MDIINFGSLNIDYVYSVENIAAPGETIASRALDVFAGGKGLNQSVALAHAGARVYHAGQIGEDGHMLVKLLEESSVDTRFIRQVPGRTGHAIIQLSQTGQNSIVLHGGANRLLSEAFIDEVLAGFSSDTMVLLQNETNLCNYIIDCAHKKGMKIALNPSPYDGNMKACDLSKVSVFLLNEIEGGQITGRMDSGEILDAMSVMYPNAVVVLTLGKNGAILRSMDGEYRHGIYDVPVVDTTAAGDTFTGFFLATLTGGGSPKKALEIASRASSIAVTIKGAANSIPRLDRVLAENLKLV